MTVFVPVIVISLILLVITILLAIADRLLVNYGECKITVYQEDEQKEFVVQGGAPLRVNLTENGISVNSSCGGKATCGYCKVKVLSGGGQILPTEEIFMSRAETLDDIRLACQVKVKNDVEIFIPDFLTTVRGIIENETYDPKLRWRVTRGYETVIPELVPKKLRISEEDEITTVAILEKHIDTPGPVVPVLQDINKTFNYLPETVLRFAADKLDVPLGELYRVATFYNAFSLKPRGRNIIRVCMGTSCYVKGGQRILDTASQKLGIDVDEATEDLKFGLETVSCIGCCGQSPVISVNEEIYGYFKPDMLDDILQKIE